MVGQNNLRLNYTYYLIKNTYEVVMKVHRQTIYMNNFPNNLKHFCVKRVSLTQ